MIRLSYSTLHPSMPYHGVRGREVIFLPGTNAHSLALSCRRYPCLGGRILEGGYIVALVDIC